MLSTISRQQQSDLAGKTKLTLVSVSSGSFKLTFFVPLKHDSKGKAILPKGTLDMALDRLNVKRGHTFTIGA